jgi:hypothetical protein
MHTTPSCLLSIIGASTIVGVAMVWFYGPPWSVREVQGVVVSWRKPEAPRYYKMVLLVRTDDGRQVSASSRRRVPPNPGDRVLVQERVGPLGKRFFVEILARRERSAVVQCGPSIIIYQHRGQCSV